VRRVLKRFPSEQVLFLRSQDLLHHHKNTLARIAAFLDIPPFPETGPKREFQQPEIPLPSGFTREDRAFVADFVRDDIRDFAHLTRIDIHDWPTMKED